MVVTKAAMTIIVPGGSVFVTSSELGAHSGQELASSSSVSRQLKSTPTSTCKTVTSSISVVSSYREISVISKTIYSL